MYYIKKGRKWHFRTSLHPTWIRDCYPRIKFYRPKGRAKLYYDKVNGKFTVGLRRK